MYITSRSKQSLSESAHNLQVNGETIEVSTCEKLLGVHIDSTLNWIVQVENTLKKCNSLLFLLGRIKYYLSVPMRKLFYNAYILPHIDYCCTVWGNCNVELINRIICFQKRAARLILDKTYETPSQQLFTELNWMTFDQRIKFKKAILMFKTMHNAAPSYLNNRFTLVYNIHSKCLRSNTSLSLYVQKPKHEIYRKSFSYSGAVIWNSLPDFVKNSTTIHHFKENYLKYEFSTPLPT
jgi:hypothetical protein